MKRIRPLIDARVARYREHPFIVHLRDERIPAEKRLAYAPYACHFVLTFSEINAIYLRDSNSDDARQAIVNEHADEDAKHWAWFLRDLGTLGMDPTCTLSEALTFIWSEHGKRAREMGYWTISAARDATPNLKLVLIEALEAMGNVWLANTLIAARAHKRADDLVYFGQHHLDRETGHAMVDDPSAIDALTLGDDEVAFAEALVNGLFDRMEEFNSELLTRVERARTSRAPLISC